ncbi:MAG: aromatic-ring-hydroxylating dioxygenase subunit beta, partial [Candidatus Binatia bacterium]
MTLDRAAVESFLYREARLMDTHRYDEWLALFDEDATYWIPSNRDDIDPRREVSI